MKTKVKGRSWTHWYKLPFIDYNDGATVIAPPTNYTLGSRLLKKGMEGADVKAMQELLLQLGYKLPKYGADGDFGSETEAAVLAFQKAEELEEDGKYGDKTHAALMDAVADDDEGKQDMPSEDTTDEDAPAQEPTEEETPAPVGQTVVIVADNGGKVNIRVGNDTRYKRITTVPVGTTFEYVATASNGWNAVVVSGQVGWVSGKYSKIS